jgi:hypothetical protein
MPALLSIGQVPGWPDLERQFAVGSAEGLLRKVHGFGEVAADVIKGRHWHHIKYLPLAGLGPSRRNRDSHRNQSFFRARPEAVEA